MAVETARAQALRAEKAAGRTELTGAALQKAKSILTDRAQLSTNAAGFAWMFSMAVDEARYIFLGHGLAKPVLLHILILYFD